MSLELQRRREEQLQLVLTSTPSVTKTTKSMSSPKCSRNLRTVPTDRKETQLMKASNATFQPKNDANY